MVPLPVSPVPVSTPSVPVADKNSQRRPLQRGVAGRHLNKVSYLSEASKAAANKATRRARLALEKTRVKFEPGKNTVKVINDGYELDKGLWATENNKKDAETETLYEPARRMRYVDYNALKSSYQPYKPTFANTAPLSPGGNAYVRPLIKNKKGAYYPYRRTSKTRKNRTPNRRN